VRPNFFALPAGWKMVLTTTFVRYTKPKAGRDGERYTCMHTGYLSQVQNKGIFLCGLYVSSSSCYWTESSPRRVLLGDNSKDIWF
jgi:hypothetical protein